MALNPIAYTEKVVRSFLRYQLTAYPFADPRLHAQMRELLSLDRTRRSPLLKGPYVSLSRPFRQGAPIDALIAGNLLHPHLRERIPREITHLYGHQERAIRAIAAGRTTLVSTGTGSGKTECFLYPIVSRCLQLRDEAAPPGISAVIVYPMNALAEDQLMRLRSLLAGTGIPFGIYVGKTPEGEAEVAGVRLPAGSSRADYEARLARARRDGKGETVYPPEEVCSREAMRSAGRQPRILLTNVKQLELLLTRQQDVELFADARLDFLVFDEAHTFTGALGAETACLIRRLRAFCDTGGDIGGNTGGNADAGGNTDAGRDRRPDRRPGRPAVLPREGAGACSGRNDGREPDSFHADRTTCVATSATIVDREAPEAARNFAARFFGVAPEAVTTVGEDYEAEVWAEPRSVPPAPGEDPAGLLDRCVRAVEDEDGSGAGVRAVWRSLAGEELGEGARPGFGIEDRRSRFGVEGEPSRAGVKGAHPGSGAGDAGEGARPRPDSEGVGGWPEALYVALSRNELVFRLNEELETPRALDELPPALERHVGRPVTEAEILIWLTLGAAARHEGRPLLRPVVHGFVRGIGGAVVSFPEGIDGPRLWLAAEDEAGPAALLDGEREKESATSAAAPSTCGPTGESGSPLDRGRDKGPAAGMGRYPQCSPSTGRGRSIVYRDGELPGLPGGRNTIVPASAGEREGEPSTSTVAPPMSGPVGEREGEPPASREPGEGQNGDGRPARATPVSRSPPAPPADSTTTSRFSRTSPSPARGRAAAKPAPRAPGGSLWTKRSVAGASSSSIA